jgi:hypothetical protein
VSTRYMEEGAGEGRREDRKKHGQDSQSKKKIKA